MQTITSAANPLVRSVKAAVAHGGLARGGWAIAEGFHLLDEALRSNIEIHSVVVAESAAARIRALAADVIRLPDQLFASIASTETSQGVMTLIQPPRWPRENMMEGNPLIVILDGIQDPGNAGAICRSAEAFGATGALFLKGSVSPWNPKTLRASAGSLFRLPVETGVNPEEALSWLGGHSVGVFAAMPGGNSIPASRADLSRPCGIAIGSEGQGLSDAVRNGAARVAIATHGVESLNAAVAASILLYEASRQRASPQ